MLGLSAFTRKPRQYSYKPIYFDPEKEEREERRRASLSNAEQDAHYVPGSLIQASRRSRIMGTSHKPSKIESADKQRRIILRLAIFLILLFLVGYVMMKSNFFEVMLSM
ncbi:MAG: hypothetical protein RRZ64_04035 [Rikenellaceae bacterium]